MDDDSATRMLTELRAWIETAAPGARLPSSRSLVERYAVSPLTVQRVVRTLARQGLVESRPGVGTFVRTVREARGADHGWQTAALAAPYPRLPRLATALRTAPPDAIALHAGYPDRDLLPERLVRTALGRAARGAAALARTPSSGLPELQAWFAQELEALAPVGVAPPAARDVLVLPGSQSGLGSVFRALVGAGQPLLVESPTYWGTVLAAAQTGVRLVPVPSGPDGPDVAALRRALDETGARAFYAQPTYANPTGAQWSADVGEAVLQAVRDHGAFLVEDDWAHDLGIDTTARPLAAQDPDGHVVYLRSLTKSLSPAVRVAAVVARGPARERLLADQGAESMYVSGLLQAAALDVVTQPGWATHLRRLRERLRARRDLLAQGLAEHVPTAGIERLPPGGLNLWLRLPDGTDLARLVRDCEVAGLLVASGEEWFPAEAPAPYVRLGYAGPDPHRFPEGARVLGEALAAQGIS